MVVATVEVTDGKGRHRASGEWWWFGGQEVVMMMVEWWWWK